MNSNVIDFNKARLVREIQQRVHLQHPRYQILCNAELRAFSQITGWAHRTVLSSFDEARTRSIEMQEMLEKSLMPVLSRFGNDTGLLGVHVDSGLNPKKWEWRVFGFWSSAQARMNFEGTLYSVVEPYILDDFWGKVLGQEVFTTCCDGVNLEGARRLLPPWGI